MSCTSVDFPLPLTPVTQVNRPTGIAASRDLRLLPEAPGAPDRRLTVPFVREDWETPCPENSKGRTGKKKPGCPHPDHLVDPIVFSPSALP